MTTDSVKRRKKGKQQDLLIKKDVLIKEAMRKIGQVGERMLFVVDNDNKLLGSLTDGDIRRWFLSKGDLKSDISKVYNRNPFIVSEGYNLEDVKQLMLKKKIEGVPVVSEGRKVKEILLWSNVFKKRETLPVASIDIPIVVMAGGKGTRLDPFTRVLPKPLIPVENKTIIEIILEKFAKYGVREFTLSINHKSRMIKAYFDEISPDYKINYIEEEIPLGTAGSLRSLENIIDESVLVTNCDIIIESNYAELIKFHNDNDYDLTIVGSFRHFTIPYGVCEIENGGNLVDIKEKPEYDFLVNTGMYVIRKEVLKLIPKNTFFNMTDLIKKLKEKGANIGVFPIDEKSWMDVGQWKEYRNVVRLLEMDS